MKVKFLYRKKFNNITPTAGTASIKQQLLDEQFLVVQDKNRFIGVITPEDLAKRPYNLVLDCVEDRQSVSLDQDVDSVLESMNHSQSFILPVFNQGDFVGVILQSDILEYFVNDNVHLEQKVKEHTLRLQSKNQQLREEIEQRKAIEEQLCNNRQEWINTFNSIRDIIIVQDKTMRIVKANQAACTFFQVDAPEKLEGKSGIGFFDSVENGCLLCRETETLESKADNFDHDTLECNGRFFDVSRSSIYDKNGHVSLIVTISRDITNQKKLEADLVQSQKMEAIGTLAGGIAHDFNNILTAILGYSDLAKITIENKDKTLEHLDQIFRAGLRAKEMVQQILTFSRKGVETVAPLKPAPIVKETLKFLHASLPTSIEIKENIDSNCGTILISPTNFHQIIMNLCTNALHAMEAEKGTLTIQLANITMPRADLPDPKLEAGKFVCLRVKDTGCGMNQEKLKRAFEPYFTTKELDKGTGMGLAMTHGIVQNSGGFIRIESTPGQGSTFYIYLPSIDDVEICEYAEVTKRVPLSTGNEHILLVDDDPAIVNLLKTNLEMLGYKITAYTDSMEALKSFLTQPGEFNLLITDQTMPRLVGSELVDRILAKRPDLPVILCTGYNSMINEQKALQLGVKKFLAKPVCRKVLASSVRELLNGVCSAEPE